MSVPPRRRSERATGIELAASSLGSCGQSVLTNARAPRLNAECVWLHRFENGDHAFEAIRRWMTSYHEERQRSAISRRSVPGEIGRLTCTATVGAPHFCDREPHDAQGVVTTTYRDGRASRLSIRDGRAATGTTGQSGSDRRPRSLCANARFSGERATSSPCYFVAA